MTDLAEVLASTERWKPATIAVAVTDASTTLASHGPTGEVLPLASVTKPLTAYAVLVGVNHGLLRLDEPCGPVDGATVRHLLAHASGLPSERDQPANEPGTRRVYSNWAYELLGELVAERSHGPFDDFLELEVLGPIGMVSTTLEGSPASGAAGTVDDLLSFARELLEPTLIDPDLYAQATRVAFDGLDGVLPGFGRQRPNDWGLGVEIRGRKDPHWLGDAVSPRTFGHFGQSGSFLWIDPDLSIACVELADEPFGEWAKQAWPPFADQVVDAIR